MPISCPTWKKKPSVPKILFRATEESPKPTAHQARVTIARLTKTFATPAPTFFCLEKPISSSRKPACMNMHQHARNHHPGGVEL